MNTDLNLNENSKDNDFQKQSVFIRVYPWLKSAVFSFLREQDF